MQNTVSNVLTFLPKSLEKVGQDKATKLQRVRMTRHSKKGSKALEKVGQDGATSRINYPMDGSTSRHPDPLVPFATPEERRAFIALVNRTGRNELARQFSSEWKAFCGMMERKRTGRATVDRRLATFKAFLLALGPCPSPDHRTVDRIDTFDREYAPGKVRWATPTQQANNRPNTIMLDFEGEKVPLTVVAEKTGQKADTMRKRLRDGWTPEEVVAGKRLPSAPVAADADVSDGTGPWPKNVKLSKWSAPYIGWVEALRQIGQTSGASEAVFVAYVTRNRFRQLAAVLRERHGISLNDDHASHAFNRAAGRPSCRSGLSRVRWRNQRVHRCPEYGRR